MKQGKVKNIGEQQTNPRGILFSAYKSVFNGNPNGSLV